MADIRIDQLPLAVSLDDNDNIHVSQSGVDRRTTVSVIQKRFAVGHVYFQLPGESDPATLGYGGTWQNVSSTWSGNFLRVEGGLANGFNTGTQADRFQGHERLIGNDSQGIFTLSNGALIAFAETQLTSTTGADSATNTLRTLGYESDGANGTPRVGIETNPTNETIRIWRRIS